MNDDTEPLVVSTRHSEHNVDLLDRNSPFTRNSENMKADVIFVVAFDTKKGNIIEWCYPSFMTDQLEGLEFKSLPSGAHTQQDDFVYMYLPSDQLYGVACFEKLPVTYEGERGARMKSLGLLTQSNEYLHIHQQQLKPILSYILLNPGEYTQAEDYQIEWSRNLSSAVLSLPQQISCPDMWFEQTLNSLGPSLFVIWKAMMVSKRVLMYSPPPASYLTKIVHCAALMKSCTNQSPNVSQCLPLYYINIADSEVLGSEISFLAYTTEKVFSEKKHLYDVYAAGNEVQITTARFQKTLGVTSGDKYRFRLLMQKMRSPVMVEDDVNLEDRFYSFFYELNSCILGTLGRLATADEVFVRHKDMMKMHLHHSDEPFLQEVIDILNYDLTVDSCVVCKCIPL